MKEEAADLTTTEEEELQQDLRTLRTELEELLAATSEDAKPVDLDTPIGRLSRMDAIQQQEMTQSHRRGLELRRAQVNASLSAAKLGTYGLCRRCEEPIGYRRLKARPETPFCLDCQGAAESPQKH